MQQPFDQTCINGEPRKVYEGMYLEYVVRDLSPYTAYEFQVQSANDAGPIDFPVWVRAETTADGTSNEPFHKKTCLRVFDQV